MSRILEVLWILVRIGSFWIAVFGFGRIMQMGIRRFGYDVPVIFLGLISLLVFSVPLSLLGLFNRSVLTFFLIAGMLFQLVYSFSGKRIPLNFKYPGFRTIILLIITIFLVITNTLRASEPHSNPDALVSYAVQPDRWLDDGRIFYLNECKFSGYPMVGEIIAAWPASLSSTRTDQLSVLQVFQMSMLLIAAISAWRLLGTGKDGLLITVSTCMATSMLAGWASFPKIEMTVLFFVSIAFASLIRDYLSGNRAFNPVPFLALGLALSTKLTSYLLLPSFLLIVFAIPEYRVLRNVLSGSLIMLALPVIFAVNTMVHTGTPFYPNTISLLPPDSDHVLLEVPAISRLAEANAAPTELLVNKDPEGLITNISELFRSWGLPSLLFLFGIASLGMRRKLSLAAVPLTAVLLYALFAVIVVNPVRWGAKYAFLMSPVLAATGAKWTKELNSPRITFYGYVLLLVLSTSIIPRAKYLYAFPGMSGSLDFRPPDTVAIRPLQEWCNSNLPEDSRLLSMWKRERYFSDHDVIVIENHPLGRRLFLAGSIDEEMELLDLMEIDYVYFQTSDPMPGNLENSMSFLFSDKLEIIIEVGGFTLCRINY